MKRNFLNWTRLCTVIICAFFALATLGGCSGGSDVEDRDDGYGDWNPDDWGDSDWNPGNEDNPNSGTCTITFWPCAPEGTPEAETLEPITVTVNVNSEYTLPDALFNVKGYFFLGWAYEQNSNYSLSPGYELYIPYDYDLYARWGTTSYINGLRISENMVVGYIKDELPADVVIPEGVIAIGSNVFYDSWEDVGCDIIKSITIPASVQSIGVDAFLKCPNLEKVIIEDGSQLSEIGYYAFGKCTSLKNIELPESVKSIDYYTFEGCSSLESVAMNSIEIIEKYAFWNSGLASVHLPNTLKSIGDSAFFNCALETVIIPDSVSVENMGEVAFGCNKKLKKAVLPDGWEEINNMFAGCERLVDIKLPSALKIIGDSAFDECHSLKEIVIPEGVTEIGDFAFHKCKSLQKVNLDNIKKIGERAFLGAPLSEIILPDDVELCRPEDSSYTYFTLSTNLRLISLPPSLVNAGIKFKDIIEEYSYLDKHDCPEFEIPIIDDNFSDCRNVNIVLREGATRVPKDFFDDDMYRYPYIYKSIKIPDGVKTIEESALYAANFEDVVELPDSVTVVENHGCGAVNRIQKLPSKLESIGYRAFVGCDFANDSVTIPGTLKFIDEFAFYCSDVKSVTIEPGVTEIPGAMFAASASLYPGYLEKVEIPNTVTKIGPSAFFYQPNLKDIKIPDSVKSIRYDAFVGCENLNAQITGKWYREKDGERVDAADPSGKNLYYYSDWNWYRED